MIWRRLRPGQLMRRYDLTYTQADRIIRHYALLHWRRYGWIGAIALALLAAYIGCGFADRACPARPLLLAGGSLCTGLQLWLAQRAAYHPILQEAEALGAGQQSPSP